MRCSVEEAKKRLEFYPLGDAANVDVRRAEMDLEPLADCLAQFELEATHAE